MEARKGPWSKKILGLAGFLLILLWMFFVDNSLLLDSLAQRQQRPRNSVFAGLYVEQSASNEDASMVSSTTGGHLSHSRLAKFQLVSSWFRNGTLKAVTASPRKVQKPQKFKIFLKY